MSKYKPVVHLRVYRGNGKNDKLSYDEDGKVENENILVKLVHASLEWVNYLKNLRALGFVRPTVEKVYLGNKGKDGQVQYDQEAKKSVVAEIQEEVNETTQLSPMETKKKSKKDKKSEDAKDQRIKELEQELAAAKAKASF